MKKCIYSIVAATALFASCSQDAELNEISNTNLKAIKTIGVSTEVSTRAVVSSEDNTKVNWEKGDLLGVFGTNSSSEAKTFAYELITGAGSTQGTFQNNSSEITTISAVMYPYQESATWADSKLTCEIPSVQTAVKGSFDKATAIMYSIGNTAEVKLNSAVNFLKVTIGEQDVDIHSITISSPSTLLSGRAEITSSGVAAVSGQSLKSVTLTAGKNQTFEMGEYYIAVMASEIVTPTISIIRYEDGHKAKEYAKNGSSNLVFADGKNVKPIKVDFAGIINSTYTTGHEAVQLWDNGPYWATVNIGAKTLKDYGTYFAWGDIVGQTYNSSWSGDGFKTTPQLVPENPDVLPLYYDAAAANWNTAWRMPTGGSDENADFEFNALKNNTTNCWYDNGWKFTGKGDYSGNTLYFVGAGNGYQNLLYDYPHDYWSNTLSLATNESGNQIYACHLFFTEFGGEFEDTPAINPASDRSERFRGYPVRAVLAD